MNGAYWFDVKWSSGDWRRASLRSPHRLIPPPISQASLLVRLHPRTGQVVWVGLWSCRWRHPRDVSPIHRSLHRGISPLDNVETSPTSERPLTEPHGQKYNVILPSACSWVWGTPALESWNSILNKIKICTQWPWLFVQIATERWFESRQKMWF